MIPTSLSSCITPNSFNQGNRRRLLHDEGHGGVVSRLGRKKLHTGQQEKKTQEEPIPPAPVAQPGCFSIERYAHISSRLLGRPFGRKARTMPKCASRRTDGTIDGSRRKKQFPCPASDHAELPCAPRSRRKDPGYRKAVLPPPSVPFSHHAIDKAGAERRAVEPLVPFPARDAVGRSSSSSHPYRSLTRRAFIRTEPAGASHSSGQKRLVKTASCLTTPAVLC